MESAAGDPSASLRAIFEQEQVRLSVEQVRRIPLPHFVMDVCLTWTAWHAGVGPPAAVWLVAMTLCQVGRTLYVVRADRAGSVPASQMLGRLGWTLAGLGAVHAVLTFMVFAQPPSYLQYILTMIMVGNAAGAISPAAGNLRSYLGWAAVFGGSLALCWILRGGVEGYAIAGLIVFLFVILSLYVRDQGEALLRLVQVTESLRHERDRAERASEAKTRFFAAASHDLRQPLTALSYNAATVQALAARDKDETLERVSDGISRALAESRGLVDSLLELSQLDASDVKPAFAVVDVIALLNETVESSRPLAGERGLLLYGPERDRPILALTDVGLLRRIAQNLLGNAIKFTAAGHVRVEVRAGADGDGRPMVVISVSDTGPGIPLDEQDRIFEEFYQVGNPERNRSRGLGLGLAIVRRLAALIGATVSLRSEPGRGACFEVAMQQADANAPLNPSPAAMPGTSAPRVGRVLFVDDEPDIRVSLTTFLQTVGWEVRAVASSAEALATWAQGFAPDALVLDFRLNDHSSGLETLKALREKGCTCPALMITGDTAPSRIAAVRAAGVPVLYKPVDGHALIAALSRAIA